MSEHARPDLDSLPLALAVRSIKTVFDPQIMDAADIREAVQREMADHLRPVVEYVAHLESLLMEAAIVGWTSTELRLMFVGATSKRFEEWPDDLRTRHDRAEVNEECIRAWARRYHADKRSKQEATQEPATLADPDSAPKEEIDGNAL